jgi:hypothetical protein
MASRFPCWALTADSFSLAYWMWGVLGPILAVPMRPGLCKMRSRAARQTATQGPISKFTIGGTSKSSM